MEASGSTLTISEQQPRRREGSNTEADVAEQSLISSEEWLQLHGLKSNRLTLKQILSQIGFPHCEDYVASLGKFVASRYADGLFPQVCRAEDGTAYKLTAKSELICQFVERLTRAVESYRQRMDWLTSGSRQVFGVILEKCVAIVLDLGGLQEEELTLCQDALKMVLREQVAHIAKFNIIWASAEPVKWQEKAALVTEQSVAAAIRWVEKLTLEQAPSPTSRLDALLEAGKDETVESIYYFVVGDIPEESKQPLLQRVSESPRPVCTVSFNARGEDTIAFLKDLTAKTRSRFHPFAQRTEQVEFPAFSQEDSDSVVTWNTRKLKGKPPPGAGVREDVFLIWREMEEACSSLAQVRSLAAGPPRAHGATDDCVESEASSVGMETSPEDTWDSKKWLQKHGLKAQKLSFYDVLADCSFRHADGVVDIKTKPENECVRTSAETNRKIVHAKYCSRFIHAPWKDGSLVHVCVTKEKCRRYSERVCAALAHVQRRIKWLQEGSQILFGKARHDCVYILVDTSHSMKGKLDLVKDKIIRFIQEQLKFKRKFNFVQFDAQAVAWREALVEIDDDGLKGAQSWVQDLQVGSSTNTLSALQIAFADKDAQAVYLLTDGRPDQPPEVVLDQVKGFRKIPIYAISFNYKDQIANGFLRELASLTGGEFHAYGFGFKDPCPPEAVQNEDLSLLLKEVEQGHSDLEKVQDLYSESLMMDWWYHGEKEGDSKHQKEICSLVSTPGKCADPHSDVEATWLSSLKASEGPGDLSKSKDSEKDSPSCRSHQNQPAQKPDGRPQERRVQQEGRLFRFQRLDRAEGQRRAHEGPSGGSSLGVSSANWLKTHGLAARKLTLTDLLSGAVVPHSPAYVPVLDEHAASKVFDEVLPLARVCSNTNKMMLINPHGVKLSLYRQKVEQAIKSYEKRLNKIVWRALSQEEKEKLDANKPMRYLENKEALNQALERLSWPISLKELSLLENEILAGKRYVQQARELQEAARQEAHVSRVLPEQQKSQGNSTKKMKSKKLDHLKGQKVIARCDENGFYFPGVVKKCLSPTHALVGFRYGDTKAVPIAFITPVGGAMPCPLLQVGDYVFAKIVVPSGFDFYVPAIVIAVPDQDVAGDKFYTVLKCNNRREFCPRSALIKISQNKYSLACSHIKSPPVQDDPKVDSVDMKNSAFLIRPSKEAGAMDFRELRQDNPRRRKKKYYKRLPLQEVVSSDSEDPSHGNRSPESSSPKRPLEPQEGGGQPGSPVGHPEILLKSSARELTPQFPGQLRSQYSEDADLVSNADIRSPEKGPCPGCRSQRPPPEQPVCTQELLTAAKGGGPPRRS